MNQGTLVYTDAPDTTLAEKVTCTDNGTYYADGSAAVSAASSFYKEHAGAVDVRYTVNFNGKALTKDTDYTETITNSSNAAVNNPVDTAGDYTLTVTGIGKYAGSLSHPFTVFDKPQTNYLDAAGAVRSAEIVPVFENTTKMSAGWYAVTEDVTVSDRINVSGDVHLILCDNATLIASKGIGVTGNNSLTVYAQSTGDSMGALFATGPVDHAGIGGATVGFAHYAYGDITINGGRINASTSDQYCAGIGGSYAATETKTITINGGDITASGGYGIGAGSQPNSVGNIILGSNTADIRIKRVKVNAAILGFKGNVSFRNPFVFQGTLRNCRSSVVITEMDKGSCYDGGFVGSVNSGADLTIEGCIFDGKLLTTTTTTFGCSGFVGNNKGTVAITDSLYSPLSINSGETEVNANYGFTFVKNLTCNGVTGTSTITNSYYTRTLGTAQGKLAHTITAGENVTLAPKGKATAYSVSGITAYADNDGLKYGDKLYAGNEDRVALTLGYTGTPIGCTFSGYSASEGTLENGVLTMPDSDTAVTAVLVPDTDHFSQDGDTYTIHDATGWDIFCELLAVNSKGFFTGKTVKLDADISVARMAGSSYHDFTGTFDGQEHTLTVAYGTESAPISEDKAAPFQNAENGCVIKNLHTAGTICTSKKFASGLIGTQYGTARIENCRSSVVINSSTPGDGTHGGFAGNIGNTANAKLTIDGCVFDGKILSADDTATTNCAGFVGYKGKSGTVTITNSIYAPADLEAGETEAASGSTFVRNGAAGTNCYYTRALDSVDHQGKAARTITAGENVKLALSGEATEYTVSGITAFADKSGLKYGDTIYAGNEDNVSLTLGNTAPDGFTFKEYSVNGGTLTNGTLTMPDENVTVSAAFDFSDGVGARLIGHSISLEGDIGVNFYMSLSDEIAASNTAYMQFTIPSGDNPYPAKVYVNEQSDATLLHAEKNGNYYVFKCSVAAKEMTSNIKAQIIDGETPLGTEYNYSVEEYANYLLAHTGDNTEYEKAAPLVRAMLRYGAYAKEYFDKTNTLVPLGDVAIDSKFETFENNLPNNMYDGATLSLKSQTTFSLYFNSGEEGLTFTCIEEPVEGQPEKVMTVETVRTGSSCIARIRDIAASKLQKNYIVTVKNGETEIGTITYSPMNYCCKVLNNGTTDTRLQNVVKALYWYSEAANEYFG